MYKLYYHPFSQHSRRVVALLNIAGLEHQLSLVDLAKGESRTPEYLAQNPNHQVPSLLADGFPEGASLRIHESNAILRFLCNQHRLGAWYPVEPLVRAEVDQWLDWTQCRLGPAVSDIVFNRVFAGPKGDQAAIARGEAKLAELAPILDAALAGSEFLVGSSPTIADLALASCVTHLQLAKAMPPGAHIAAWLGRMCEIEGFRNTIPERPGA